MAARTNWRLLPLVGSLIVLATLHSAVAQERPRIGYLGLGQPVSPAPFVRKMQEAGYLDGKTATVEYRFAEGRRERLRPLAQELVDRKVDVLFAWGDEAIDAALSVTRSTPIVMLACDAVTSGFVESLARPGGNATGVTCLTTELSAKRIATFNEMIPRLNRLAVLYNPFNKSKPNDFALTRDAAIPLGISVQGFEVTEPEHIRSVFAQFLESPPDGVSVLDESFTIVHAKLIVELAHQHKLATMHSFREPVDAGGLLSYGPNLSEMLALASSFVPKILKGTKPAYLPVMQPTRFELVINLKTAKILGLTVPPMLLARADEVIE